MEPPRITPPPPITPHREVSLHHHTSTNDRAYFLLITALLPVSEEVRSNLRPGEAKKPDSPTLPYPGKLESGGISGSLSSLDSQVSIVITTPSSPQHGGNPSNQAFVWPTECQNMLLDPGIVNDTQTQALLLTTLVRPLSLWFLVRWVTGYETWQNLKTKPKC